MTATTTYTEGNTTHVQYHDTRVVSFNNETIKLDSGGWQTATTKRRMNQTSDAYNLGFKVEQKSGDWFVDFNGKRIPFTDGMTIERNV